VAVIVTEMVVRGDGEGLDTSVDEELGEDRLELGLAGLQVITTDERLLALSELDDTGNEGVLGSTVDEGLVLEDGSNSKEGGRRNLGVRSLDGVEEVIGGVVNTRDDVAVALSVGGPEDNDTVQAVVLLELADVGPDVLEVDLLVVSGNQVVSASLLVGSDEVGVVDGRKRLSKLGHVRGDLALKIVVQNLGTLHGLVHREARDIPSTEDEVVGVDHRKDVGNRDVDILASGRLSSDADSGSAENGTNVVGLLDALLGVPDDVVTVGKDGSTESGTVVASNTDHEQASLGDSTLGLELVFLGGGFNVEVAIGDSDLGTAIDELRGDVLVGVLSVLGLNSDRMGTTNSGGVDRQNRLALGFRGSVARGVVANWCHCRRYVYDCRG